MTLSTAETAGLIGVSVDCLLEANQRGEAPVRPIRVGTRLRWPTALVLDALGIPHDAGEPRPGVAVPAGALVHTTSRADESEVAA